MVDEGEVEGAKCLAGGMLFTSEGERGRLFPSWMVGGGIGVGGGRMGMRRIGTASSPILYQGEGRWVVLVEHTGQGRL